MKIIFNSSLAILLGHGGLNDPVLCARGPVNRHAPLSSSIHGMEGGTSGSPSRHEDGRTRSDPPRKSRSWCVFSFLTVITFRHIPIPKPNGLP